MSGIRKAGGGGISPAAYKGGSGIKPKGGSGAKPKGGSGIKPKGGSDEWLPPGLQGRESLPPGHAKKIEDGFDAQGSLPDLAAFASLLGWMPTSSAPTPVTASDPKPTDLPPVDLGTAPQTGKAPDLPFISQYTPDGAGPNYDGAVNCGPAILAMMAKSRGATGTQAELIQNLAGIAGTTGQGTSGNGMIAGMESLGMQTAAAPGPDLAFINNHLAQGHTVIANGDFYSVPEHADPDLRAGHYIAITGVNNGVYTITDPASKDPSAPIAQTMTAQQLQSFIAAHPEGGFVLSGW